MSVPSTRIAALALAAPLALAGCGGGEQSAQPASETTAAPEQTKVMDPGPAAPEPEPEPQMSTEQENAYGQAVSYLSHSAFSRTGLIDQLVYEGYSEQVSAWAADKLGRDLPGLWKVEAVESAESYLSHSSFSRQGLLDQLLYEGFTPQQAEFGVSQAYDG